MLLAISSAFYREITQVAGRVTYSGKYDTLSFNEFPTPAQSLNLLANLYAIGEVNGELSVRSRLHDQVIHRSGPFNLQIPEAGSRKEFAYACIIEGLVFPAPGYHMIDLLFGGAVLQSIPLRIIKLP